MTHLTVTSGLYCLDDNTGTCSKTELRLQWLNFYQAHSRGQHDEAITWLETLHQSLRSAQIESLSLPNLRDHHEINITMISRNLKTLRCENELLKVKTLLLNAEFEKVSEILIDCFNCGIETDEFSTLTQIEGILENLWNAQRFTDCLNWAEKCLHYSLTLYIQRELVYKTAPKELVENIQFILIYIKELLTNKCLKTSI